VITVNPGTAAAVYAVEDTIPSGASASNIGESGTFDASQNKVKWGPFFDNTPRVLEYEVTIGAGFEGDVFRVTGRLSLDGKELQIAGASSAPVTAPQPPPQGTVLSIAMFAGIIIEGEVGSTVTIEFTEDFSQTSGWTELATFEIRRSPDIFIDEQSPERTTRFYRVKE